MSSHSDPLPPGDVMEDPPMDQVLAEFIRRRDAGHPVDVEALCAARPDLADALRSYAAGEDLFREMARDDRSGDCRVPASGRVPDRGSALAETMRPGAARDTDASLAGRSFGHYRVMRQLGQGGMGAVYLAEDARLQRRVALKVPTFSAVDGPDARERFFREARAAAALSHPHICPVFHADESDGTPYIAMAYIDGQPLSRFVGTEEFRNQVRIAAIVRHVADALQHAHEHGIIHRDLKPGNIMLDQNGRPVVTDFGLARRLAAGQEARITQEGQLLGTPAYMSPEQIAGDADRVSRATDIYALGVVLFELLTGRLPFQGCVPEVIAGALKSEPSAPSSLRSDVDPVLESLCLQMLRKKPERRPASMQQISDHLQQWLDRNSPSSAADQAAMEKMRSELTAEQQKIRKLLRTGKFEAALKRLQVVARYREPAADEFREWAIDLIPKVRERPAEAKKNEPEMVRMAQEWMTKHDYAQAIQLLRSIPDLYRSETAEELLRRAVALQEEADDLLLDLKQCVREGIYDGIDDNLKRLLELKPGNHFAKNLQQKLQTYRTGRGRPYRFDRQGRLLSASDDRYWSRAMMLTAIVGVAVFGLMTWGVTIYLKSGDQTVAVQVDPDWLEQQGANLTLSVDSHEYLLASPELDLEISVGEHGFAVRDSGRLVHNPEQFTIEEEGRQVLYIDGTGLRLAAMDLPINAIPGERSPAEGTPGAMVAADTSGARDGASVPRGEKPASGLSQSVHQNDGRNPNAGVNSADAGAEGEWMPLFNGRDLSGWRRYDNGARVDFGWQVNDGELIKLNRSTSIRTEQQFYSFELEFEWKVEDEGNSGVYYRVPAGLDHKLRHAAGYQVIDNDYSATGGLAPQDRAASIWGIAPAAGMLPRAIGEWNSARVVVQGDTIEHWLNGRKVCSAQTGSPFWTSAVLRLSCDPATFARERGYIVLYGVPQGKVSYRNMRIRDLSRRTDGGAHSLPFDLDAALTQLVAATAGLGDVSTRTRDDWIQIGHDHFGRADWLQAKGAYARAVILDGTHAPGWDYLAWAYLNANEYDGVLATATRALNLDPGLAGSYVARGWAYFHTGRRTGALKELEQAVTSNPNDMFAWQTRGRFHLDAGEYAAAVSDFTRAIGIDPDNLDNYRYRAEAYQSLGNPAKAEADRIRSQGNSDAPAQTSDAVGPGQWILKQGGKFGVKGSRQMVSTADRIPDDLSQILGVYLERVEAPAAEFAVLSELPRMNTLGMTGSGVVDGCLSWISARTALKNLHLQDTRISDASMSHIARLPSLLNLNLSGTQVSDAGLAELHGLTQLRRLDVSKTAVTTLGVDAFKRAVPACNVIWKEPE